MVRTNRKNLDLRGYKEQDTTAVPFGTAFLNGEANHRRTASIRVFGFELEMGVIIGWNLPREGRI